MPFDVDPQDNFITDDTYASGRASFEAGGSVLENPFGNTGDWGRAWFAGWLDALADRVTGDDRSRTAFVTLMTSGDRAAPF